jgi:hypothetical protein
LGILLAAVASGGTTLVVDLGPFKTAHEAGHAEATVNWMDGETADDRACTEAFAALELQRYLRRMTGRAEDFPIAGTDAEPAGNRLFVGAAARALPAKYGASAENLDKLGPQGYRIVTGKAGGTLVAAIAGGGRVGTLYGAYDLLHRLGCRWFAPEPVHEEIPTRELERLPELDVTERPDFLTRGFHAWEDRGDEPFLLWMARNRLNYWCVQQSNHPLMRKLGIQMSCGGHTAQPMFLNPYHAYPYDHPKFDGDEAKPTDPYPPSEDYRGDANKDGTLSYFEAHPDWFALVKGKRVHGYKGEFGTNYCTSNPHATTEFMKNYVQALVDGPYRDATVVRFWTLDGGKWCQCQACKALGIPTDRNLLLVHRLAQEIKKAQAAGRIHRRIIIRFLAYHDVLHPPTRPLPEGFDYDMCSATFFPIVRCYVHPFADADCSRNSHYRRQLHGWAVDPDRHYTGQLCIGEYYNVSGYKCLPIVYMHTMARDIPFYHTMGARHFHYMHVVTQGWGNKALTNWQMARQLWAAGTDCEALWEDYFARRYGPAAGMMRDFYESLETMLCNVSRLKYGLARRLNAGSKTLFPNAHLRFERAEGVESDGPSLVEIVGHADACRTRIDQAAKADVPDRIAKRIAEDERLFTYGERTVRYYYACARAFRLARAGKRGEAQTHYAEAKRLADLLRTDTASTQHSSSHANAPNAFAASRATGALGHIEKLLGKGDK